MKNLDITIALIVLGIALLIFLSFQIGSLPKSGRRSLLFIISAAAAIFGISVFSRHRLKLLNKELKERESKLKEREEKLKGLKEDYQTSEKELNLMKAKLEDQLNAYRKMMLQIKVKNKKEKERIEKLSGEDLHHEFFTVFENES